VTDSIYIELTAIFMTCPQDQILAFASNWNDHLHIPYMAAKRQDGLHDRMSIVFVPVSSVIDWAVTQPIGASKVQDAPAASSSDAAPKAKPANEAAAADAAHEHLHDEYPDHDRHHGQSKRNGLEPKVIGMLVSFYRYMKDSHGRNWKALENSAQTLYYQRENITKTVDRILYK